MKTKKLKGKKQREKKQKWSVALTDPSGLPYILPLSIFFIAVFGASFFYYCLQLDSSRKYTWI